jgi:hypothetical protein
MMGNFAPDAGQGGESSLGIKAEYVSWPDLEADHPCGLLVFVCQPSSPATEVGRSLGDNEVPRVGEEHVIKCFYVNPLTGRYWLVQHCAQSDSTSPRDICEAARAMLFEMISLSEQRFSVVLIDKACASADFMLLLESAGKMYWCQVSEDWRLGSKTDPKHARVVRNLEFDHSAVSGGKVVNLNGFPENYHVRLFRLRTSAGGFEFVAINQSGQGNACDAHAMCRALMQIQAGYAPTPYAP